MFWQALIIGILICTYGGWQCGPIFGWTIGGSPLLMGTIVGFVLGDVMYGMQVGAMIQLAFLGLITAGGVPSTNKAYAGYIATALTMLTHSTPEMGVTIAVSLGFIGMIGVNAKMTVNSFWTHRADRCAKRGDTRGIAFYNVICPQIVVALTYGVPAFLAVFFGAEYFQQILDFMPEIVLKGMQSIGMLLPALGLALMIKSIFKARFLPFFAIGFVFTIYMGIDVIGITILGVAFAALYWFMGTKREEAAA